MTDIGKFLSDLQKILKHDRQNNSGSSNYERISKDICSLFVRASACPGQLPKSIFHVWESNYIYGLPSLENEPSEQRAQALAAMLAFLSNSDEYQDLLTQDDWEEISDIVNAEADDMPLDLLQDLMGILVSKGTY